MKTKKVLITIAFVALALVAAWLVWRQNRSDEQQPPRSSERANQTSELGSPEVLVPETYVSTYFGDGTDGEFIYDSDEFKVDAVLPTNAVGRPPVELAKMADAAIADFVTRNEAMRADFADRGVTPPDLQWQFQLEYETKRSGEYTTYLIKGYEYTGGAHGLPFYQGFTYDSDVRPVDLADVLVVPVSEALPVFAEAAKPVLSERLGEAFFEDGLEPTELNWQTWYLEDGTLNFVFGPYQVGPYAAGRQDVTFDPRDFSGVIGVLE